MIETINTGPHIITTSEIYFDMRGDVFSNVSTKKLITTLDDSAPKANHGSVERVRRLFGNKTAGAKAHKIYQCWNQKVPIRRVTMLTDASACHKITSLLVLTVSSRRQRWGRKLNIHNGTIKAPAAANKLDNLVLS